VDNYTKRYISGVDRDRVIAVVTGVARTFNSMVTWPNWS